MNKLIKKVLDDNQHISISTEDGRQIVTEKIMSAIRTEGGWFLNLNHDEYGNPFLLSEDIIDNKDEGHIFESPDGGKTVYKREFGSEKRTLVKDINDESNS